MDLILPPIESWSESMRMWGTEDGNRAHVIYTDAEKKVIEEIAFRLDVRDLSLDLIRMICALATQLSCVLLTSEFGILHPTESAVLAAIRNSTAAKFVIDPAATLRSLGTKFGEVIVDFDQAQDNPSGEED